MISAMEHAMVNEKAKGKLFSVGGDKELRYEELIDLLASKMSIEKFNRYTYNPIKTFLEKLVIGRTHDGRMMEMFKYLESYPQNGPLAEDYFEVFNLKRMIELKAETKLDENEQLRLITPPQLNYKHFALD